MGAGRYRRAGAARAASQCETLEAAAKEGRMPGDDELAALYDVVDKTTLAMFDMLADDNADQPRMMEAAVTS